MKHPVNSLPNTQKQQMEVLVMGELKFLYTPNTHYIKKIPYHIENFTLSRQIGRLAAIFKLLCILFKKV